MSVFEPRAGLDVAPELVALIEEEVLPGLDLPVESFWTGVAGIFARLRSPFRPPGWMTRSRAWPDRSWWCRC